MILTSNYPNVPLYVGNPATDLVRRDNARREVIEPVREMARSGAEKGVQADDKGRDARQTQTSYQDDSKTKGLDYDQAVTAKDQKEQDQQGQKQSSGQQSDADKQQQQAEQKEIAELKARDQEVRVHEQAHAAIGGQYAGSPSYEYETGPDGQKYAVGGEVQIDISEIPNDPQATIAKMQQVKAAALAPAEPSGADRAIAAEAGRKMQEARAELVSDTHQEYRETSQTQGTEQAADPYAAIEVETGPVYRSKVSKSLQQPLMQLRSEVIAGFYSRSTVPSSRPLLQTA
ncbi:MULTISPECIES: putative metalloprotease CJM1_0395 family protein [Rheinheimera]|uniref:Metalloprotease CJM1_0395 family protein n=1 Tax=Rheinheimera marina TaxID=1774958 RepID=A0ABV9JGF8_9GAMM